MPSTVFGLPTHALFVHATVVLIPLATLAVLVHAVWPAARRRLGALTPLLALVALVLTPLSTASGEQLERMVGHSALVEQHAELADGLMPWVIGLFVTSVAVWLVGDPRVLRGHAGRLLALRWVPVAATVLAVVAAVGTAQQVVRVGHAGAEATWSDVVAHPAQGPGGPPRDGDDG